MATMNVSLPDEMKNWVEEQTDSGHYANASDYVRDLIRHDQVRKDKATQMQTLVTEALESGTSKKSIDEILRAARKIASTN